MLYMASWHTFIYRQLFCTRAAGPFGKTPGTEGLTESESAPAEFIALTFTNSIYTRNDKLRDIYVYPNVIV